MPWPATDKVLLKARGYTNFKKIGHGVYSTVHQADYKDPKLGGQVTRVAIKFIDLSLQSDNYKDKLFPRELKAVRRLKHKNIVPVKDVILSKDRNRVWIVMELEKCDLLQILDKVGRCDEDQGRIWVRQMMQGLKYMHDKEWAHRDLKVENVLIGFDDRALLSDFGFSRQQTIDSLSTTHLGSMQYSAPEVLETKVKVEPFRSSLSSPRVGSGTGSPVPAIAAATQNANRAGREYDAFKADVWGLGVIMFVMFIGFLPVNGDTEDKIRSQQEKIHKVIDFLPPDLKISPQLTDLIRRMLTIEPGKRISLDEAIIHPWITSGADVESIELSGSKPSSGSAIRSHSSKGLVTSLPSTPAAKSVPKTSPQNSPASHVPVSRSSTPWLVIVILMIFAIVLVIIILLLVVIFVLSNGSQ